MNKNVFKIFLNEDINDQELDEALPKDLAKAYDYSGLGKDYRSGGYRSGRVDWQNTDYIPLTPEQGKELWKNNPKALVLIIRDDSGNPRAVKFREDGKVDIDPAYGNYRFNLPRETAYIKRDGTKVRDVFKAKINHLLDIAEKIYQTNEGSVTRDTNLLDTRKQNPESPNYPGSDKKDIIRKYNQNGGSEERDLMRKVEYWKNSRQLENIGGPQGLQDLINNRFQLSYDPATGKVKGNWSYSYGGEGNINFWKDKVIRYFQEFSAYDSDTLGAWLGYLMAEGKGTINYRVPTEGEVKKWYNLKSDWKQNMNAEIRYLDVKKILEEPKQRIAQSIEDAKTLEKKLSRRQADKDSFTSPESRASRESDITYYINDYKRRLNYILNELEKYEGKLDDLDAEDAKKIKDMDDEINQISQDLANAQNATSNIMAQGAYTNTAFGKKVPESLQEEKSLDELVDILQSRKTESLDEDFGDADVRVNSLAEFLDIDPEEIKVDGDEFITPEGDYLVLTEEEAHGRAVDEIKMLFFDMGLESFTPQFQQQIINEFMSDEVVDDFVNQEIEYFENEEDDAEMLAYLQGLNTKEEKIDYIKEIFGDLKDFVNPEDIDIDAVAEEAINQDGIAHFVAYYDGDEEELGNGFFAYRIN